jgi:serine/threonine-protein kinase
MLLDPAWSFEQALAEISSVYTPGGYFGGPQRNRMIEAWGQLVGRNRAVRELDQAVVRYGSLTALGRAQSITVRTLRSLREYYLALPVDPHRPGRLASGDVLGSWHLVHRLGSGANAEVWKARSAGAEGAIKVLRRNKGRSLQRFRAEIDLLHLLGDTPGILPIVDCHAPTDARVWFVMPLATPVLDLDRDDSPRHAIAGLAQVAETMANLHARRVFHRDLKPENLYKWNNRWVVGDLGIASFPGKAALTTGTGKLGPVHFIAPEMLHNPQSANGGPADVYSLAKTLWVLVTGQRYPPPGEQREDIEQVQLERWVRHDDIQALNSVLASCTRYAPETRWRMAGFRDALLDWLERY